MVKFFVMDYINFIFVALDFLVSNKFRVTHTKRGKTPQLFDERKPLSYGVCKLHLFRIFENCSRSPQIKGIIYQSLRIKSKACDYVLMHFYISILYIYFQQIETIIILNMMKTCEFIQIITSFTCSCKKVIEKQMNVIATVDQNIVFESPVKNNPVKSIAHKISRYFL